MNTNYAQNHGSQVGIKGLKRCLWQKLLMPFKTNPIWD